MIKEDVYMALRRVIEKKMATEAVAAHSKS
jgi:hypothetical protein